jgi:hypothetical protein
VGTTRENHTAGTPKRVTPGEFLFAGDTNADGMVLLSANMHAITYFTSGKYLYSPGVRVVRQGKIHSPGVRILVGAIYAPGVRFRSLGVNSCSPGVKFTEGR